MAIGARDYIDRLLVEKYSKEQVDNHNDDSLTSRVSPDDMWNAINASANSYRNMLLLNERLSMVCYGIVAKTARYNVTGDAG